MLSTCALVVASPAIAQDATPTNKPDTSSSVLDLGIDFSVGYSDNLFATRNYKVDDLIFVTRPTARFTLKEGQDSLVLRGSGEIGRYKDVTDENYDDWLLGADGRVQVSRNLTLLGGGEYQWEHESRESPDAENGFRPTKYRHLNLYSGAILRTSEFTIRPAMQFNRYNFDDVAAAGGTINNDDRDRSQYEIGARIVHSVADETDLFVQGAWDSRTYDERTDDYGFRRSSEGGSVVMGIQKKFSPRFNAEFFAGYLGQDYDDPRLEDVRTFDVGALVKWTGPRGLGATFRLDRSVEETTLPGASSYLLTAGSLTVSAMPHPKLQTGISLAGSQYDYRGEPRAEFVISGDLWLRYWLDSHIYTGLDYGLSQRTSNAAGYDYDENRLMFRLGADLRPHYSSDVPAISFGGNRPAGLYAGLFVGHGALVTGLDGPRGQGSNTADFGDTGFAGGAMLGYGTTVGDVYVGAELEAQLGGADWLHTADRVFSVEKKNGVSIAGRVGWLTPSRDLAYGRFGVSSASLDTQYNHAEEDFGETERYGGLSFGVGAEAGTAGRGFVRVEYVVTSYRDVNVPTGNDRFDNFSTSEGQFRLGAGFRFGAPSLDPAKAAVPTRFDGPYIGLQFGHGGLVSQNLGVRSGGTSINIQRAGLGPVGGMFAGIGVSWNRLYFGAEAEADISGINWNIERDPNGRVYSAEQKYTLGAAARAGWMISDFAILYGRIGPAWTRFRIPFATSNDSVVSKRTRGGLRMGGGMELGIGARARLRLDYSTTDYGGYDVEYGEDNSDQFDHRDNLFRAGIAWGI
jgi:hypothetical protein